MTQDIPDDKTFAPSFWNTLTRGPGRTWLPIGAGVLGVVLVVSVGALLPEDWQHRLFDLVVGCGLTAATFYVLKRAVISNIGKPHAELRSLACGMAAAGAIFALLLYLLNGDGLGWLKLPGLLVASLLTMIGGACLAGLVAIVCYWPVHLAVRSSLGAGLRTEGASVGALAGLVATLPLVAKNQLSTSLCTAAVVLATICTHRAAMIHERKSERRLAREGSR
ncbi:MAG: hypothetical protein JNL96_10020 [Planctomycetaceae bacterium]|nr:hypothetical protein [Planctomycetaceae bacterium]